MGSANSNDRNTKTETADMSQEICIIMAVSYDLKGNYCLRIITHLYPKVAFLHDPLARQLILQTNVLFARAVYLWLRVLTRVYGLILKNFNSLPHCTDSSTWYQAFIFHRPVDCGKEELVRRCSRKAMSNKEDPHLTSLTYRTETHQKIICLQNS